MRSRFAAPLAVTLLAAIALAGCTGQTSELSTPVLPVPKPVANALAFSQALALPKGDGGNEPSITIDPKSGTIYASTPRGVPQTQGATFWVSTDGGKTFTYSLPTDSTTGVEVGGGDSALATDAGGAVYLADLSLAAITVLASTDQGKTWSSNPVASGVPLDDRQWLAGAEKGTAYLVYNELATGPIVSKSTDGGATWVPNPLFATAPLSTAYKTQADFSNMGNIAVAKDGTVYVVWTAGNALAPIEVPGYPYANQLIVSTSTDGGTTWTHTVAYQSDVNLPSSLPALALDSTGTAYAVWLEPQGKAWQLDLTVSKDKGKTWSKPVPVSPNGTTAVQPWIAADGPGKVAIVWYGANEQAVPDDVKGDWFVDIATSTDATMAAPTFAQALVSPASVHKGGVCTVGIMCTGNRELGDFFQVAIDPQGSPHVVWAMDKDAQGNTQTMYAHMLTGPSLK